MYSSVAVRIICVLTAAVFLWRGSPPAADGQTHLTMFLKMGQKKMAEYFVYVLQSQTLGIKYIGQTWNLEKRIIEHNLGLSKYTKGKGPWKIVYSESFATRSEAMKRERFLKSGQGREQLKQILKAQNTER